jgi:hypothetical protein
MLLELCIFLRHITITFVLYLKDTGFRFKSVLFIHIYFLFFDEWPSRVQSIAHLSLSEVRRGCFESLDTQSKFMG